MILQAFSVVRYALTHCCEHRIVLLTTKQASECWSLRLRAIFTSDVECPIYKDQPT